MKIVDKKKVEKIQEYYKNNKYKWDKEINIIAFRNPDNQEKDIYNDMYLVVKPESFEIHAFICTTDPGKYWTKNPLNRKGTAHLCEGFYKDAYTIGKHRGYLALVQWGAKVCVWRDKNKNFVDDDNIKEWGFFGINHHKQSWLRDKILKASAGCQVIKNPKEYENEYMPIFLNSKKYASQGNRVRFSYCLTNFKNKELQGVVSYFKKELFGE